MASPFESRATNLLTMRRHDDVLEVLMSASAFPQPAWQSLQSVLLCANSISLKIFLKYPVSSGSCIQCALEFGHGPTEFAWKEPHPCGSPGFEGRSFLLAGPHFWWSSTVPRGTRTGLRKFGRGWGGVGEIIRSQPSLSQVYTRLQAQECSSILQQEKKTTNAFIPRILPLGPSMQTGPINGAMFMLGTPKNLVT